MLDKIITATQFAEADKHTIAKKPIASIELMEYAAKQWLSLIPTDFWYDKKTAIVCGSGNNGGDGFVVSRLLKDQHVDVDSFLVPFGKTLSADCEANYKRLNKVNTIRNVDELDFNKYDVIVDAIFGTGINRQAEDIAAQTITAINESDAFVFSIDVPSGLVCDGISISDLVIHSDLTITFQRPKLSFFLPENNKFLKQFETVDIGLDEGFIQSQHSTRFIVNQEVKSLVNERLRFSHKGSYGHALLMAGSYGKIGAAVLASKACLRAGAGLLTSYVPKCGYNIMQQSLPEAMCLVDEHEECVTSVPSLRKYSALGIGPGIGTSAETKDAIQNLLKDNSMPLVLDADAINIISENSDLVNSLGQNCILTPHIKEFDRLVGESKNSLQRFEKLQSFAKTHACIVVLKDAHTCISDADGNLYFNTSGNPGMATGGSGDVLTGIILGLLAQQYSPLEAALIGVYFHGLAGDFAAEHLGENALIASDIIENLCIEQ